MDQHHQTVREAVEVLRDNRYTRRESDEAEVAYLHDLEALVVEVLLNMRLAGIGQPEVLTAARTITADPLSRAVAMTSGDSMEQVAGAAFQSQRDARAPAGSGGMS